MSYGNKNNEPSTRLQGLRLPSSPRTGHPERIVRSKPPNGHLTYTMSNNTDLSDLEKAILTALKANPESASSIPGCNHTIQTSPLFRAQALKLLAPVLPFLALPMAAREQIFIRTMHAGYLGLLATSKALHKQLFPILRRWGQCRIDIGPATLAKRMPTMYREQLPNIMNARISILRILDPKIPDINGRFIHLFAGYNTIRRHCQFHIIGVPGRLWALTPESIRDFSSLTCFRTLTLNLLCRIYIQDPTNPKGWKGEFQDLSWNDIHAAATDLQGILGPFTINAWGAHFQPYNFILKSGISLAAANSGGESNPEKIFSYVSGLEEGARPWYTGAGTVERNEKGKAVIRITGGQFNPFAYAEAREAVARSARLHLNPPAPQGVTITSVPYVSRPEPQMVSTPSSRTISTPSSPTVENDISKQDDTAGNKRNRQLLSPSTGRHESKRSRSRSESAERPTIQARGLEKGKPKRKGKGA